MSSTAVHRFAYRGWQVAIRLDGRDANGAIAAHAELEADGAGSRRIVIDEPYRDCGAALRRLAQGARFYVDDWQRAKPQPAALQAA